MNGRINTASDAIRYSSRAYFAEKRWNQDDYKEQAQEILTEIWEKEVVIVNGKPYLVAGNWAAGEERPTLNPSYFSFAAYPIFAEVDPAHPWLFLKDTSYEVLNASTRNPLDERRVRAFSRLGFC
jgi:endo-1,4-beta-D-glucanase Y